MNTKKTIELKQTNAEDCLERLARGGIQSIDSSRTRRLSVCLSLWVNQLLIHLSQMLLASHDRKCCCFLWQTDLNHLNRCCFCPYLFRNVFITVSCVSDR